MRYLLPQHAVFPGLLSKEDLYTLVEHGSITRGELCTDTLTQRDHTVGEVIQGMRPPRGAAPARVSRPQYQEFRADDPYDEVAEPLEEDTAELAEEDAVEYTESGEAILFFSHPAWLSFLKAWLLALLLFLAAVLLLFIDEAYAVVCFLLFLAVLLGISIARACQDYLITEERVEVVWGLLGRNSNEVRVRDILSMDVREKGLRGLLGIGTLDVSSAANAGVEVSFRDIRHPHDVKQLLRRLQRELESGEADSG
jgi:Bacterial PH domain